MIILGPIALGLLLAVIRYSKWIRRVLGAVLLAGIALVALCLIEVFASRYIVPALVFAVLFFVIRAFAGRSARS